ncbi:hypothetical protein HDU85_003765 [Gaertneriomyces sp. JEL0708]|nr:hypothetical protein HDU85_003765 [Gaertneriomyces sp. JEL0708]
MLLKSLLLSALPLYASAASLVDTLVGDARFSTLTGLATQYPQLIEALGKNDVTVFAPTNAAFEGVSTEGLDVARIVGYHVLTNNKFIPGPVQSAHGADRFFVKTSIDQVLPVRVATDSVTVGNNTKVTESLPADNGVVHVIDSILLPPGTASAVLAAEAPALLKLLESVQVNPDVLKGVTIFAPSDESLTALQNSGANLTTGVVTSVLNLHIVPKAIYSTDIIPNTGAPLANNTKLETALDDDELTSISVSTTPEGAVLLRGAGNTEDVTVTKTDLLFNGGVIHLIDNVLLPKISADGKVEGVHDKDDDPNAPVKPDLDDDNIQGEISGAVSVRSSACLIAVAGLVSALW